MAETSGLKRGSALKSARVFISPELRSSRNTSSAAWFGSVHPACTKPMEYPGTPDAANAGRIARCGGCRCPIQKICRSLLAYTWVGRSKTDWAAYPGRRLSQSAPPFSHKTNNMMPTGIHHVHLPRPWHADGDTVKSMRPTPVLQPHRILRQRVRCTTRRGDRSRSAAGAKYQQQARTAQQQKPVEVDMQP